MEYFVLFFPVLVEMDALAAATPTTAEPGAPVVAAAAAAAEGEGAAGDAAPASAPATVHGPDPDPDPDPEQPPPANGLDDDGEPQLQPSWRTPQPCPALPAPTPPAPLAPTPTPPSPTTPMSGVEFAGQVLRVNANVAVVALTAPCGATRLCAILRGQVRVNGGARAWEAPLPTLLAVGLPVCVRPRPAAQDEAAACRWVSDELLLEQCVRAPTRVRCAEITRLAGKDGEVQVVVAGRCAAAAFSRKNVVLDGAKLPSGCLLSKSGLEVGWAAAVRLEPVLVAPGGGGGEGERPQLRAAELMTTTCAHTRRRLELRLVDGDALADALAAEGAQPLARRARLLRVDDDVVTAALQPELFAVASDDDRPLLVQVRASEGRLWVNGRTVGAGRAAAALRAGWPALALVSREWGQRAEDGPGPADAPAAAAAADVAVALLLVSDDEVLGEGEGARRARARVTALGADTGVAEFPHDGVIERALFTRAAVRAGRPCQALQEVVRLGQEVEVTLTLSGGPAWLAFSASAVEPVVQLGPALALDPDPGPGPATPAKKKKTRSKKKKKQAATQEGATEASGEEEGSPLPPPPPPPPALPPGLPDLVWLRPLSPPGRVPAAASTSTSTEDELSGSPDSERSSSKAPDDGTPEAPADARNVLEAAANGNENAIVAADANGQEIKEAPKLSTISDEAQAVKFDDEPGIYDVSSENNIQGKEETRAIQYSLDGLHSLREHANKIKLDGAACQEPSNRENLMKVFDRCMNPMEEMDVNTFIKSSAYHVTPNTAKNDCVTEFVRQYEEIVDGLEIVDVNAVTSMSEREENVDSVLDVKACFSEHLSDETQDKSTVEKLEEVSKVQNAPTSEKNGPKNSTANEDICMNPNLEANVCKNVGKQSTSSKEIKKDINSSNSNNIEVASNDIETISDNWRKHESYECSSQELEQNGDVFLFEKIMEKKDELRSHLPVLDEKIDNWVMDMWKTLKSKSTPTVKSDVAREAKEKQKKVPVSDANDSSVNKIKPSTPCFPSQINFLSNISLNIPPVNEEIVDAETLELAGPFHARVVTTYPRSAVATFRLQGIASRAFFFRNNVVGTTVPPVGTNIILESLERVAPSQMTKKYKSTLNAKLVKVCVEETRQAITGRTGSILKYADSNTGYIEVTVPDQETILSKFTKNEVKAGSISEGKSLQKAWPPGTTVHFHGELIIKGKKREFFITHVWPQGRSTVSSKSTSEKKDSKTVEVEEKKVKIEKVLAHTGRVSQYLSSDYGLIDFRLGDLQLSANFRSAICSGLLPGRSLSEHWPPATIVHFDGELLRSNDNVKFNVLKVWAGKRTMSLSIASELPPGSVHVGVVTEHRPPAAFVVTLATPNAGVKVFVLSRCFRTAIDEPQLQQIVTVKEYVHLGQRVWVKVKRVSPNSKKDCEYIALDAWPEIVEKVDVHKTKAEGLVKRVSKVKSNSTIDLTSRSQSLVTQNVCSKTPGASSTPLVTNHVAPAKTVPAASVKGATHQGLPHLQAKAPGGARAAAAAVATRAGSAARARVVLANATAALLRVLEPPAAAAAVAAAAAAADAPLVVAHARGLYLCGVLLAGLDLTLVLAPGQELTVHFLKEDEKRLSADASANQSNPALQNCVYLSVLWLGGAHFDSPTRQFAELATFCREHKVSDTVYHQLTQRLGQMLKHERGKLKSDSSDDDDDKWIADTNKGVDEKSISENTLSQQMSDGNNMIEVCQKSTLQDINQKDESMATEQDSSDASQIEMLQQLKEVGPEDFLQIQLRNLTFSVLEESLHSVQEYFLNSLQENCSDTALCNLLASQTPAIVQDAALNFILEMEKKFLGNGPRGDSRGARAAAELEPCRACAERSAAEVATAAASQPAAAGAGSAEASTKVAAAQALLATATPPAPAAPLQQPPPPPPPPPAEPAVAPCGSPPRSGTCARKGDEREPLLADARGESGDRDTQEDLQKAPVTSLLVDAMQEAVLENAQIKDSSELTVEEKEQKVKLSENKESQKLDAAGGDKLDCQDLQKSLNAEIQKHAQELAVFRDEAYQLIENWKTSDSPPATPEELEFLQELSLLLDQRPEKPDDNTNKDAYALAHQLLKFWKVANFPLSPVAQRGLQRLQEALEVLGQKAEGKVTMENNVPDDAEGIREVEAALREVRDAFRDVKHVFEVQRCFRDLRECFREVRRAYRTREPRPRALPPCADAPAAAAAAAAAAALAAEALAQAKKRGHASSEVSGSRTPSPPGTPLHSQPKKKQQQKPCPTCNVMAGGMGEGVLNQVDSASGAVGDDDAAAAAAVAVAEKTTEAPQAEVSKSFQSAATMTSDLESTTVTSTLDQAAQTISTGAVLALHLLPDE